MTNAEKTQRLRQLAQQERESFLDPMFGGLADSPNYEELPEEESFIDPRFGGLVVEHQEQLATAIADAASSDPELQKILEQAGVHDLSAPQPFRTTGFEGSAYFDGQAWYFEVTGDDGKVGRVKIHAKNRDSAFVSAARFFQKKPSGLHELTEAQKLHVAREAQRPGGINDALQAYCAYSFPKTSDEEEAGDILENPLYREALEKGVWYVFKAATADCDARTEDEFRQFVTDFAGDKPLTVGLLQRLHEKFRTAQIERNLKLFGDEGQSTARDLDSLSDDEVAATLDSATREYARAIRSQRRR